MVSTASFPRYTATELALDRALHVIAIALAAGAVAWLFLTTFPTGGARQIIASAVYGVGLIGMFVASAAYSSCKPCRWKELLRRIDHAMIFVMIAGTCTPFALTAFPAIIGLLLCAFVWIVATIGIVLNLAFPRRFERLLIALYLVTGWTMFGIGRTYAENLSSLVLFLLFVGGMAYSCGVFVHLRDRLPFHNVAWHGLVLLGAGSHWGAVTNQIKGWAGP
jgi:hemolysin III